MSVHILPSMFSGVIPYQKTEFLILQRAATPAQPPADHFVIPRHGFPDCRAYASKGSVPNSRTCATGVCISAWGSAVSVERTSLVGGSPHEFLITSFAQLSESGAWCTAGWKSRARSSCGRWRRRRTPSSATWTAPYACCCPPAGQPSLSSRCILFYSTIR